MLEDMRRTVRDASLVVKNLFNQYDHHANGCITGEQFLRVINCHALLSADKASHNLHLNYNEMKLWPRKGRAHWV